MILNLGSLLVVVLLASASVPAAAQDPNVVTYESSRSGTVEKIAAFTRMVTFRFGNVVSEIYVPKDIRQFDELQVGDRVTVRYVDEIVVRVAPHGRPSTVEDTTAAARREGAPDAPEVLQQLRMTVTIESLDPARQLVVYRGADNRSVMRTVQNPKLLEGLKAGDVVEITSTRARAISIER